MMQNWLTCRQRNQYAFACDNCSKKLQQALISKTFLLEKQKKPNES